MERGHPTGPKDEPPGPPAPTPPAAAAPTSTPIPAPGLAAPADERRQITAAFVDLVGSTELASHLDPEDWHDLLDAYQSRVASIISEHGGAVIQFQGDGVLACFGFPQAAETAARDAVSASLSAVDAVKELHSRFTAPAGALQARAGIHTGVVVVTGARTGAVPRPADIFGEVPNLAARLQTVAQPGQVVISDATSSAVTGYFELSPLAPLPIRGIHREVRAFHVLRAGPATSRLEASRLGGFVSRHSEWGWLRQRWEAVLEGSPRAALIAGEPGIGKSRLVLEFARSLAADGAVVHTARCTRASQLSPLQPFSSAFGRTPHEPGEVVRWVSAQAEGQPTVLVIDDAQWADPSSLEVVERLLRLDVPLLVLLTARPESIDRPQTPYPVAARLTLDRLSDQDAAALVARIPGASALSAEVVREVVDRADGVPLYLEELARTVIAHAGTGGDAAEPSIEPTVSLTDVITARLDRLGPARRLVQLAAVIGREFDIAVLADVARLDAEELRNHVAALVEQAIIAPDEAGRDVYLFRHALIHDAAYGSLMRQDRRAIHEAVADSLAAAGYEERAPQVLAYHLGHAGRAEEAARMWRVAARTARRRSRFREAAGHERQILKLLPELPPEQRDATELSARSRLALCLEAVDQESSEVIPEAARAQALARSLGDHRSLLQMYLLLIPWWQARTDYRAIDEGLPEALAVAATVDDPFYTASVRLLAGTIRVWEGRFEESVSTLTEAFAISGSPLEGSLSELPQLSPPGVIIRASTRMAAALCWWIVGDATTAWQLTEDTIRFTAERKIAPAEAVTAATAAMIAQLEGDHPRTAKYAQAALMARAADERPDDGASHRWQSWAAALGYWAGDAADDPPVPGPLLRPYFLTLRAEDGRLGPEEALALVDEALATVRRTGEAFCEAEILRVRGRLLAAAGQPDQAALELASAAATARIQRARSFELKALLDLYRLSRDPSVRTRLSELVRDIGDRGPGLLLEKVRALLVDGPA